MKWTSNYLTKSLTKQFEHLLPLDFIPMEYVLLHPDLILAGVDDEQKAKEHYLLFGKNENRNYKKTILKKIKYETKPEFWNNGKNLLYFSPMAPDYDCSSGGNRLFQILKILKIDLQYNVWFLCNGYHKSHHLDILKNIKIPVFLPDLNKNEYLEKNLLKAKKDNINFSNAIFSWYDIGNQYIEIVKSIYPDIKIIVDSVDVHWIREQRGKDNNHLNIPQESIDFRKDIEKSIYRKADVIFAITEKDKQHIQEEIGYEGNIKILSNIHDEKKINLGNNMIFIGNFNHGPNIAAVKSCIKIHKLFQKTETFKSLKIKPKLIIAGDFLQLEIQKEIINNPYLEYIGHVPNLESLYQQSNLLISPLDWGAGIKGKICDAGMCGLPILTSDIGNEGIDFKNKKNALIANEINEFVDQLEYFYKMSKKDKILLGLAGQHHLSKIVSKKAALNILNHSLQDKHIVISIVTYNQKDMVTKCIKQILDLTIYKNYIIYLSDNSSNNYTKKSILSNYKEQIESGKIVYHKNKKNYFFIKPNNDLFKNPEYGHSDFVLVNDDIEIKDGNWLSYLYSSAYSADYIAAAGGKTIYPNGKLAEAGAELYNDGFGRNIGRNDDPNKSEYNQQKYVGYCSGCLLYMRHDAIDKVGIFSEKLKKLYYEDSDWQYRSHFHGLKTIYEHRCHAIHNEGSSSGTDVTKGAKKYQIINKKIFLENMKKININFKLLDR